MQHMLLATHAAAEKPLKTAITASGVKDMFVTPLLNHLISLSKSLRRSTPQRKALPAQAVNQVLHAELLKHVNGPLMNPLLQMKGALSRTSMYDEARS